jgi:hypothetical protein
VLPADEFSTNAVRLRSYAAGEALALLRDRFAASWLER